jgi:hypothetical protein
VPALEALATWLTPAFYIDFGRPCDAACLYCSVPPHEDAQGFLPFAEVDGIIAAGKAAGCDRAILIGGEPTVYPQLDDVLARLADHGLAQGHIVMTNGVRLHEPAFLDRLWRGGVRTLHVSFDTTSPEIYDALSRTSGRHGKLLAALRGALAHGGFQVYLYTVVTRLNAADLPRVVEHAAAAASALGLASPPPVVLAVTKPVGDALRYADTLLVAPDEAPALLRPAIETGRRVGVPVGYRNVQACLAPDLLPHAIDYYLDDFSVELATGRRVSYSHTEYWTRAPACASCGHAPWCGGIYAETARRFGTDLYHAIGTEGLRVGDQAPNDRPTSV